MFLVQRQVPSNTSSLAYLFGCGGKGKSIAVDVHLEDVDWFIEQAKLKDVDINYVVDTHIHADHLSGGRELAQQTGGEYMLHESAIADFSFTPLQDDDELVIGNVSAKILHTPGHTADSICLLVSDNRRSSEPWFLMTGHTLFVGSTGRPDLQGQEEMMAGVLHDSLHDKILPLAEYIEIYPGAQAGSVCGAGLSAKPVSTLAFEKRFNTTLSYNRDVFIQSILSVLKEIPDQPADMEKIIQRNSKI
ncbi:MAG: MBL fold metallo-hydrolase [Thiotrichaceae bacterium]